MGGGTGTVTVLGQCPNKEVYETIYVLYVKHTVLYHTVYAYIK